MCPQLASVPLLCGREHWPRIVEVVEGVDHQTHEQLKQFQKELSCIPNNFTKPNQFNSLKLLLLMMPMMMILLHMMMNNKVLKRLLSAQEAHSSNDNHLSFVTYHHHRQEYNQCQLYLHYIQSCPFTSIPLNSGLLELKIALGAVYLSLTSWTRVSSI